MKDNNTLLDLFLNVISNKFKEDSENPLLEKNMNLLYYMTSFFNNIVDFDLTLLFSLYSLSITSINKLKFSSNISNDFNFEFDIFFE